MQINYSTPLHITKNSSVAVTLLPCPLVDAKHSWCSGCRWICFLSKLSKQYRSACKQAQFAGQPCACSATERERDQLRASLELFLELVCAHPFSPSQRGACTVMG